MLYKIIFKSYLRHRRAILPLFYSHRDHDRQGNACGKGEHIISLLRSTQASDQKQSQTNFPHRQEVDHPSRV